MRALGVLPAFVHREGDLVAVDGGDGAVEDGLEGGQVRRVVDEARGDAATGGRVAGRVRVAGRIRRLGRSRDGGDGWRRLGAEAVAEGDRERERDRADDGEPTDPRERAARMSDGGIVLSEWS